MFYSGRHSQAEITWVRERTNAVTKVHLAAISLGPDPALEESRSGRLRRQCSVDDPLPTLVVWVDTDDGAPYTPTPESLLVTTKSNGAG